MKCHQCGFNNKPGKKFCTTCGTKLTLRCSRCGAEIESTESFCGSCGHDLHPPKLAPLEPAPVDYTQPPSYTPKHLSDQILTSRSALEGERKLVTVLFADVASYTSLCVNNTGTPPL